MHADGRWGTVAGRRVCADGFPLVPGARCYCDVEFVRVGWGAPLVICKQGAELVRVGRSPAVVNCSQRVGFVRVRGGAAIVFCSVNCSYGGLGRVLYAMSCHVMSFHVMSCHVMLCHLALRRHVYDCATAICSGGVAPASCPVTSCHVALRRVVSNPIPGVSHCGMSRRGQNSDSRSSFSHTTPTHTILNPTAHSHTTRLAHSRGSIFHPRLAAFRLPTHVLRLNFRCGVLLSYYARIRETVTTLL